MNKPLHQWTVQEALDYLHRLDRKKKLRLLSGLGGGLLFLILIFWPAWIARPQIQGRIQLLRNQIEEAQAQVRLEPKLLEEQKRYETLIEKTQARLLTESESQGLLGILTEIGKKSRVTLLASQPQSETQKVPAPFAEKYVAYSYLITVEGGYHALATFVSEIENHAKLLRVDEFSVMPQEETPLIHLGEIRLSIFLMQGEEGEPNLKKEGGQEMRPPSGDEQKKS